MKACKCRVPKVESVRSEAGEVIAFVCVICGGHHGRPPKGTHLCFVCLHYFRRVALHHQRSKCGEYYRRGLWWTRRRPAHAPPALSEKTCA